MIAEEMKPSTKFHGHLITGSLFDLVWPQWLQCDWLQNVLRSHPPRFMAIRQLEVCWPCVISMTWRMGKNGNPIHQIAQQSDNRKLTWPHMVLKSSMWPPEFIAIPSTMFYSNPTSGSLFDLVYPHSLRHILSSLVPPCTSLQTGTYNRTADLLKLT
jgi:hypothetical protein